MTQEPERREEQGRRLRAELAAYEAAVVNGTANVKETEEAHWEKLVGPTLLQAMLKDRETVERCLVDPNPSIRGTALCILSRHWKPDVDLAAKCEELAVSDPVDSVRCSAIRCLSSFYRNSSNVRVGAMLARIVHDDAQSVNVRIVAYHSLFSVRGVHLRHWPSAEKIIFGDFHFPEDVDWSFVDTFSR